MWYVEFITRVSIPAARRFRNEYARILDELEEEFPDIVFNIDTSMEM